MSNSNDTSSSLLRLVGRKHKAKLGADLNESVATGPNAFARAQLEKLGWKEGTGLGKNRDGRSEHIRVTKRESKEKNYCNTDHGYQSGSGRSSISPNLPLGKS